MSNKIAKIMSTSDYLGYDMKIGVYLKEVTSTYESHSHEFYEIEMILLGDADCVINGKKHSVSKGDVYFVTPADVHSFCPKGKDVPLKLVCVQFDEKIIEPNIMLQFLNLKSGKCIHLSPYEFEHAYRLFLCALDEYKNDLPYKSVTLKNLIENIVILFIRNFDIVSGEMSGEIMQKAVVYLHSRFKDGISLSDVSKYCGLSQSYFSHSFKEFCGVSFMEYLDKLRFEYAENLLKNTHLSITEVCYSSGFKSVTNFNRRFLKKHSISPTEYRNSK